jgi:beta-phosphoglucomutase-like phosphatase (HAD superfamily)
LFEVVRVTRKIRELIVARATEAALKEEAVAGGMRSMRADGLTKALAGRTTLEEVLRVTPPDPDLARRAARSAGDQPPAQVPSAVKTPPKVLVIDDDSSIAEIAAAAGATGFIPSPLPNPSSAPRSPPSSSAARSSPEGRPG